MTANAAPAHRHKSRSPIGAFSSRSADHSSRHALPSFSAPFLLAGLLFLACERDTVHPTPENLPPDQASLIVSDSLPRGLPRDRLARWRDVRNQLLGSATLVQIGRANDDGPELFGRIRDAAIDSLGNVFVLDELSQTVNVFDSRGQHTDTFGGIGDGPGELRQANAIELLPDNRVLVIGLQRKASIFALGTDGYSIQAQLPLAVDERNTSCLLDTDRILIGGGTGDFRSYVQVVDLSTGALRRSIGTGYASTDRAVRATFATTVTACLDSEPDAARVFFGSLYFPFVWAYGVSDGRILWTAKIDSFAQTKLVTPNEGGLAIWSDSPRDQVRIVQAVSSDHILVQVIRYAPMDREPSLVRSYLVDAETGHGALISEDIGLVMDGTASRYVAVWSAPYPRFEVRGEGT